MITLPPDDNILSHFVPFCPGFLKSSKRFHRECCDRDASHATPRYKRKIQFAIKDNDDPNRNANISTNFITKLERFRGVRVPSGSILYFEEEKYR
jgi:hypothetical protein